MLPKINRLPSSEIKTVLHSRSRIIIPEFHLLFQKRQEHELPPAGRTRKLATTNPSRFAVIVSIKIDKRAVKRNRMKRLIHESIYRLLPTIRVREGWNCVVIVKKNFSDQKQIEVERNIQHMLHRAGIVVF